jgi:hypothetical protein
MIEYLTTNSSVNVVGLEFPNEDLLWIKKFGYIENLNTITGIADKANVILREKSAGIKNFSDAVRIIFEREKCQHVIKIQDDVALLQNWYRQFCLILHHNEVGILSGFRHFFGNIQLTPCHQHAETVERGYTGGLLMAISKKLCERSPILLSNEIHKARDMDDFWIDACREAGMKVWVTQPGSCQHIGFKSEIYTERKEYLIDPDKKYRAVDKELFPPYAFTKNVKKFVHNPVLLKVT